MTRLNLGCGERLIKDYINIDLYDPHADVKMDCIKLDYPDNSVDEIKTLHLFEHFSFAEGRIALREWYRILKPDGLLWIELPDMNYTALLLRNRLFNKGLTWQQLTYGSQTCEGQYHKSGYTEETLRKELELAGFKKIERIPILDLMIGSITLGSLGMRCIK